MSNFNISDEMRPDFHQDSSPIKYEGQSKAAIKWERNNSEYVVLWHQDKFRIFNGYSMSEPLREHILEKLPHETLYIRSKKEETLHKFDMSALEEAEPIDPSHNAASGDVVQYVVSEDDIVESWSL